MTAPMPLAVAARTFFPHGGVTKSTLLAAIRAFPFRFVRVRSRSIHLNYGPILGRGRRLSGRVAA